MIHDKDFVLRMVRQLSGFLAKLILEKNELDSVETERITDTQIKDIFRCDFDTLSQKTEQELIDWVSEKEPKDHPDYYEMLGHLFMYSFQKTGNLNFAQKAKLFYELYLQKSGIFALPIINRINDLKLTLNTN